MIDINEGYTNHYLVHGVFVVLLSAPVIYFHVLFWLPFVLIAIALFASSNGLLIDCKNNRYKSYGNILGYKAGQWKSLTEINTIVLKFSSNSQKSLHPMILGSAKVKKFKSFNLIALAYDGQQYTIYEFTKYSKAKKAIEALNEFSNINAIDSIAEKLQKNQITKPRR